MCENAYIDAEQGASNQKIVWDMTVDVVISGVNTYVSIEAGAAIGSMICPGPGTVVGVIVGTFVGWGLDKVLCALSYEPRRYLKSWVD